MGNHVVPAACQAGRQVAHNVPAGGGGGGEHLLLPPAAPAQQPFTTLTHPPSHPHCFSTKESSHCWIGRSSKVSQPQIKVIKTIKKVKKKVKNTLTGVALQGGGCAGTLCGQLLTEHWWTPGGISCPRPKTGIVQTHPPTGIDRHLNKLENLYNVGNTFNCYCPQH